MKKRMLILLIASVSFAPAALAEGRPTHLGEQKWSDVAGRATHCDGDVKRLPSSRHISADEESTRPAKAARAH